MQGCIFIFPLLLSLLTGCATKKSDSSESSPDKEQASEKRMALYSMSPIQGLLSGNTSLTLVGENFHPKSKVTIGDTACLNAVVNKEETRITCLTPPSQQASAQTVIVTSPGGQSSQRKNAFTYIQGGPSESADGLKRNRMLLSIGYRCTARYSIQDEYYKIEPWEGLETNFFDWVYSRDFLAVSRVLSSDSHTMNGFLNAENVKLNPVEKNDEHYRIEAPGFPGFESVHDVSIDPKKDKDNSYLKGKISREFTEKYLRRFERYVEAIKKNKQIFFIRWEDNRLLSTAEVQKFIETLNHLNPDNQDYLVLVSLYPPTPAILDLEKQYRFKYFDLQALLKAHHTALTSWYDDRKIKANYEWNTIFKWIEGASLGTKDTLVDTKNWGQLNVALNRKEKSPNLAKLLSLRNGKKETALLKAIHEQDSETVERIIDAFPLAFESMNVDDEYNDAAITSGNPIIKQLVLNRQSGTGETPLIVSILSNNFDRTKKLLDHGANPIQKGAISKPAIYWSIWEAQQGLQIRKLIFTHRNANGDTPLTAAIKEKDTELVKVIVTAWPATFDSIQNNGEDEAAIASEDKEIKQIVLGRSYSHRKL